MSPGDTTIKTLRNQNQNFCFHLISPEAAGGSGQMGLVRESEPGRLGGSAATRLDQDEIDTCSVMFLSSR